MISIVPALETPGTGFLTLYWLVAIALIAVTPFDVTVRTVDGKLVRGAIASWDEAGIELNVAGNTTQRIARDELADITFSAVNSQVAKPSVEVLLGDGSLPAEEFEWQGEQEEFTGQIGAARWELPIEFLRAVRFNFSTMGQDVAWEQLTQRSRTSDWLVVYKKSRGTLDHIEGVVERVSADSVTLLLDDGPLEVAREKVFGLIFYRREAEQLPTKAIRVLGPNGLSLAARDVRLQASPLEIELLNGNSISLPVDVISRLEFSTDNTSYLTDFEPIPNSLQWKPYFRLPKDATLLQSWGIPQRNQSLHGGPLQLLIRGKRGEPVVQEFDRGLAMRSRSEVSYRLPPGLSVLRAMAGIDPASNELADALLVIEADGQLLGEWRLEHGQPAQPIEVNISGRRRLRLLVDYGSGTDSGDIVHLCDPRLIE